MPSSTRILRLTFWTPHWNVLFVLSRSNITLNFLYILKVDPKKKPATQSTDYLNIHVRLVLNEAKGFSRPHRTVCYDSVIKISIYWKISQDHHQFGPSKHAELHYSTVWKDMPVRKVPALVRRLFLLFLHHRRTFPWAQVFVGWAFEFYAVQYMMYVVHGSGGHSDQFHHVHGFKQTDDLNNSELQSLHAQSFQIKIIFHVWECTRTGENGWKLPNK